MSSMTDCKCCTNTQKISAVLLTHHNLVMTDCDSTTKFGEVLYCTLKYLRYFQNLVRNLTSTNNNRVNVPETLHSADNSQLLSVIHKYTSIIHLTWMARGTRCRLTCFDFKMCPMNDRRRDSTVRTCVRYRRTLP